MDLNAHRGTWWDSISWNSHFNSVVKVGVSTTGSEFLLLRLVIESDTRMFKGLVKGIYTCRR